MPGRDNTGPEGNGPVTGRGMGSCQENNDSAPRPRSGENGRNSRRRGNGRNSGQGKGRKRQ